MPEITLDTKVVLELLTGESDEIKALSILRHPEIDPSKLERKEEPPQQPPEYYEQLYKMLADQVSFVLPSGAIVSTVVSAGTTFVKSSPKVAWSKLNFGWLPLSRYPGECRRTYTPDGDLFRDILEPTEYNSAVLASAIVQYRARAHNLLDMLVYSDPPVKDADGVVTIKAIITFVKQMPEEAYERPEWLMNLLSQDRHLMRHEPRTLGPTNTNPSKAHRFSRDGVVEIDKDWDIPENARRMAETLEEDPK